MYWSVAADSFAVSSRLEGIVPPSQFAASDQFAKFVTDVPTPAR